MDQIINGIIKSSHPINVKKQLLERFQSAYIQNPCSTTISITDRTCYSIINYVRELTLNNVDTEIVKFCRLCLECCHVQECLCPTAEHFINDSHTELSITFVQLLSDRLPIEIGRPFLERAMFERHELNNDLLRFILFSVTKNRQLTTGQRTIFYIKLVELVLFLLRTLENSPQQVDLFCKTLSRTIEELCYENNQPSSHLLNDIVNGVTSGLLTCLADSTRKDEPSTSIANIIDLLQECPNENLLDSFILTLDDDRLILCLNRLARCFRWECLTTKPSQWLVSIWKLLLKREREMVVAYSATSSIISELISMLSNPSTYQNVIPTLCWIFVNQPFHLQTFVTILQNEILQLVTNNPTFLRDNVEMKNLVEGVRYALETLLNTEDNQINHDIFTTLLHSLPKVNLTYAKNIRSMKCKYSSVDYNSNDVTIRLHDKVGLVNIGNTCYLNAIMQALYACTKFRQNVLDCDTLSSNNELLKSLQSIFAFLKLSKRPYYRPENFWLQTKPSYFERNQQQDCQEYLRHLLDTLHEEAKQTKQNGSSMNYDLVKEHLMGKCVHRSRCSSCSSISESHDLFYDLSIGFNEQASETTEQQRIFDLQSLIDHAFSWEPLVNENQFACDKCQSKQDGARRMFLTSCPNYLTLLLKRFVHNRLTGKYEKRLDHTTLPEYIQLLTADETFVSYRLKAIVVHHGLSMNSGHYYAFVMFNNNDLTDNDTKNIGWWLCNDTHVEHLTFENVCSHFQRFHSATPYVLMFEKQTKENENDQNKLQILPYLQTLIDRDNELYAQEQKRRGRSSRSADITDVNEPYLRNTGCKDQSPDRGPPCIF